MKDSRKVKVVIGGEVSAAICGHGREATIGGALTAADALAALRAAVGSVSVRLVDATRIRLAPFPSRMRCAS